MTDTPTDQETLAKYLTDALPVTGPPEWETPTARCSLKPCPAGGWFVYWHPRDDRARTQLMLTDHTNLCLWRDHARTWLESAPTRISVREVRDPEDVVHWRFGFFINYGLQYVPGAYDTIDAALIAAVVWVDKTKGESDVPV